PELQIKKISFCSIVQCTADKNLQSVLLKFLRHLCKDTAECKGLPIQFYGTSKFLREIQISESMAVHGNFTADFRHLSLQKLSAHHFQIAAVSRDKFHFKRLFCCLFYGLYAICFYLKSLSFRIFLKIFKPGF